MICSIFAYSFLSCLIYLSTAVLSVTLFPLKWIANMKWIYISLYLSGSNIWSWFNYLNSRWHFIHFSVTSLSCCRRRMCRKEGSSFCTWWCFNTVSHLIWHLSLFCALILGMLPLLIVLAHALCSYLLLIQFVQLHTNILRSAPLHPSSAIIRAGYYFCLTGFSLCMVD